MAFTAEERKQQFLSFVEDSREQGVTREEISGFLMSQFDQDARGAAGATYQLLRKAINNQQVVEVSERYYTAQFAPNLGLVTKGGAVADAMVNADPKDKRAVHPTDRFGECRVHFTAFYMQVCQVNVRKSGQWIEWHRVANDDDHFDLYMSPIRRDAERGQRTIIAEEVEVWYRLSGTNFKVADRRVVPEGHMVVIEPELK